MRRARLELTLALAAGALVWTPMVSAACSPPTEAEVAEMFGRWTAALETVHPDRVSRLYAPDALMLPLAAHGARKGLAEIRDYYVYFLQREPKVSIETRILRADCGLATAAGTYELRSKTRAGKPETFKVRYSFTWQKQDQTWLIVHEHASIGPDKGTPDRTAIGPADPLAASAPSAAAVSIKPKVAGYVKRTSSRAQSRAPQQKPVAAKPEAPARRELEFDAR